MTHKEKMKHTPTPWKAALDGARHNKSSLVMAADPSEYALPGDLFIVADFVTHDNAEHIVKCVNSHDALVSALAAIDAATAQYEEYMSGACEKECTHPDCLMVKGVRAALGSVGRL